MGDIISSGVFSVYVVPCTTVSCLPLAHSSANSLGSSPLVSGNKFWIIEKNKIDSGSELNSEEFEEFCTDKRFSKTSGGEPPC
jgi:hypothetical protein